VPAVDWLPSPDDVGAEIRSRTKDGGNNELGTFSPTTRPTRDQLYPLVDAVVARITRRCGRVPEDLYDDARRVAALGVAIKVERTYFPEQVASGNSPYPEMLAEYKEELAELIESCKNDDGDPSTDDTQLLPIHSFTNEPLIGIYTDR
jgi:hypothetical protein